MDHRPPPQPPLPVRARLATRPLGLIDNLRVARRNILELIPEASTHLPMISGRTVARWHMVTDPASNRRILRDRLEDYPKSDVTKAMLRPAIGDSLFVAEGADWKRQRRLAAPAFSARNVAALGPVMTAAAEAAAARLEASVGRAANLHDEMVRATFDIIADVTFSGDDSFDRGAIHRSIETFIDTAARVDPLDILAVPGWVPRPSRVWATRQMGGMKTAADAAIERRRRAGAKVPPDFMDLLLEGTGAEAGDAALNTAEMRDNLLTFIVAGHETTALALAWAFYLCAFDPQVQDRARDAAQAALGSRAATAADLPKLGYLRQIIEETMRLYPPGGFLSRTARAEDRLCGIDIRPGDTVTLPVYALHRNRLWWDAPDAFRPDRFADRAAIDRFAYLPFGDGPRICIGASFALQEAVIILATLLARYRFRPVPGRDPKPVMILTLRPEGGVWLEVERA
jgi:cytochrome P450